MEKDALRRFFESFPYGLFILGSRNGPKISTSVVNWVTQVSFHPPIVAVSVEENSRMRESIENSRLFSLNTLPTGAIETAKALLKNGEPVGSTMNGQEFVLGNLGVPVFLGAASAIECKVTHSMQAGDHVVFVGEVLNAVSRYKGDILTLKETGWKYVR